jgi:hypothetical protein
MALGSCTGMAWFFVQLSHQDRRSIRPRTLVSGKSVSFFSFLHFVHVFFILHFPTKTEDQANWDCSLTAPKFRRIAVG